MANDLISRQEALEAARLGLHRFTMMHNTPENVKVMEKVIRGVRDGIKNVPASDPGWIPVSERLPESKCFCLTARKRAVYVEFYNGVIFSEVHQQAQPTHWMPLPEPPKEG